MQAGGGEAVLVPALPRQQAADRQRLIAQAMPVLEQQQALAGQSADRHGFCLRQAVVGGESHHEIVPRHLQRIRPAAIAGQRQQEQVQPVGGEAVDQPSGRVLPQIKPQPGEGGAQCRHQAGQQERADGGDDAEAERTGQGLARGVGGLADGLQRRERGAGAVHQLQAEGGEHHVPPGGPIQNRCIELPLQRQQSGGQRGLRDGANDGRSPEMAGLGQRDEIAKLLGAWEDRHGAMACLKRATMPSAMERTRSWANIVSSGLCSGAGAMRGVSVRSSGFCVWQKKGKNTRRDPKIVRREIACYRRDRRRK